MQYGISNLSIVPMRNEAADQAEMVNQILFGEHFKVLEVTKILKDLKVLYLTRDPISNAISFINRKKDFEKENFSYGTALG